MNDAIQMGVLHRLADVDEQLQPLTQCEMALVTVGGDRLALDQLHDEVGPPRVGGAAVEHVGDVGMVHERQGLALGLEASD
jgi:hypothetical protein